MKLSVSSTQTPREHLLGDAFAVRSMDLHVGQTSPIMGFDDFRVSGRPFGPHPHAGLTALSYVFEDSIGRLRNRDSLGNHLVLGPGSICFLQSGIREPTVVGGSFIMTDRAGIADAARRFAAGEMGHLSPYSGP